jgi:uncharacterized membrane protein
VVVTVFGALHLVAAAIGLFGIASILVQPVMMAALSRHNPELQAQANVQAQIQWWLYTSAALGVLVLALLIPAAIKMLKGRKDALSWSNRYAWGSILVRIAGVVVSVMVVAPAMRSNMANMKTVAPAFFLSNTWYLIAGLLPMIYPLLALILLNRPQVKRWFDESGR